MKAEKLTKVSSENEINIESEIKKHHGTSFSNEEAMYWMSQTFARDGYLKISNIVPKSVKSLINKEVSYLLSKYSKRRDIHIETTGNSPRYLSNVRQVDITNYGKIIPEVYHSDSLMKLIGRIAHDEVIPNPWEQEKFIINRQERKGDTHGWHWGDYPYSMIWIIKATKIEDGGLLECVPHTYWDKDNPRINENLLKNKITSHHHVDGDVYLLKSDTTLHRVSPLTSDSTRIIINMAWERARDKDREVTHETFAFRD